MTRVPLKQTSGFEDALPHSALKVYRVSNPAGALIISAQTLYALRYFSFFFFFFFTIKHQITLFIAKPKVIKLF